MSCMWTRPVRLNTSENRARSSIGFSPSGGSSTSASFMASLVRDLGVSQVEHCQVWIDILNRHFPDDHPPLRSFVNDRHRLALLVMSGRSQSPFEKVLWRRGEA